MEQALKEKHLSPRTLDPAAKLSFKIEGGIKNLP
jgi:hypothetical protein